MSSELRAPGWLARHPVVGILMVILGTLAFATLAFQLQTHSGLVRADVPLASRLHSIAVSTASTTNETMTFGFFLGKEVEEIIGAILVVYFVHKRFWPELGMIIVGWTGGAAIWFVLTRYFDRVRPAAQMGIVVHVPSFPSGHTMQATLCFGLLAYLLLPKMPSLFWKWVTVIAAVLTVLFIGFSRLFQGGHYLTDLLAGYALGIAWAGLVYTVLETFALRRRV
jgi:membrane-associated phospholipid phosphatase